MPRLYAYLIGSLPGLRLGEKPFYHTAAFLDMCREHLAPAQFAALAAMTLEPERPVGSWTDRKWQEFELYLRNRVAAIRASRNGMDASIWQRHEVEVFPGSLRAIEEAMAASDPVQRERLLDELRWQRLNDLIVGHEFDFEALVNYRLRLLLVEKWAAPDLDPGRQCLRTLVDGATAQAEQHRVAAG